MAAARDGHQSKGEANLDGVGPHSLVVRHHKSQKDKTSNPFDMATIPYRTYRDKLTMSDFLMESLEEWSPKLADRVRGFGAVSETPQQLDAQQDEMNRASDTSGRLVAYSRLGKHLAKVRKAALLRAGDIGHGLHPTLPGNTGLILEGVTATYVAWDVFYHAYLRRVHHKDSAGRVGLAVVEQTVFHLAATIALPAFLLHRQHQMTNMLFRRMQVKRGSRMDIYGSSVIGVAMVPLLPFVVDTPVHRGVHAAFDAIRGTSWFREDDSDHYDHH